MLFNLDVPDGDKGGEGMIVMAVQAPHMLAFSWNSPPHLPTVRGQMTHVVVRLAETSAVTTRVTLRHGGWGNGGEWDEAFQYFGAAWSKVVLPRLQQRFAKGPIAWDSLPE